MCVLRRGAARHGQGATAQVVCEHVEERRLLSGGISLSMSLSWFCCSSVNMRHYSAGLWQSCC